MATGRHSGQRTRRASAWGASPGQAARWVALELDVRAPRTWFGPSWALLGGAVTSSYAPKGLRSLVILAVLWVMVEFVLTALLDLSSAIAELHSARPLPPPPALYWSLPYLQPASPGGRALNAIAGRIARFSAGWQAVGGAGQRWPVLALVALVLAAVGGNLVLLLVGVAIAGLALVALGGPTRTSTRELLGGLHFLLAWLIGCSAIGGLNPAALALGAVFALIWYAWTLHPPATWLLAAAHGVLATYLVVAQAPLTACWVLLLAVPLFALEPESPSSQRTYLPQTQVYLMVSMLLAAWGAGWHL